MGSYELLAPEDFPVLPWKNGQGKTTELYCERVAGSDEFAWRLSIADVEVDGPFSDFSGYDRTLVLIEGNGIVLDHGAEQVDRLERLFDYCQFSGGWKTTSSLIDGPIKDFNIMTRSEICSARVSTITARDPIHIDDSADHTFIYALSTSGSIYLNNRQTFVSLDGGHMIHLSKDGISDIEIEGSGLICVQVFCE